MSKILTDNQYYHQIADVIREQNGTSNTYTPPQIVTALKNLFYEEVEGVPPITFQGIGENLLDYRIDGASGGVGDKTSNLFINVWFQGSINSSTGIMETSSIFVCSDFIPITPLITYSCSRTVSREYNNLRCYDANKQYVGTGGTNANAGNPLNNGASFGTFMITNESVAYIRFNDKSNDLTTKYMLVEGEYTASTMPDYEPYGYKVPVVVNGKNLLNNVLTSRTLNGVTITVNQDKSINISGQLDVSYKDFYVSGRWNSDVPLFEEGTYKLIVESTNNNIPITCGFNGSYATGITGTGNRVFTNQISSIMFRLTDSMTLNNETLKIMVCKPIIEDTSYEPYHEPTTTNIYLDEPISENERISLSDTNVNIPTIRGTNVLTVDTTVQPSNVYVKSRKESQYETIMRERYEEAQAQLDALN